MEEKEKQVFDALSAQCARREYCTADIRRKALQRLDFDAAGAVRDVKCSPCGVCPLDGKCLAEDQLEAVVGGV